MVRLLVTKQSDVFHPTSRSFHLFATSIASLVGRSPPMRIIHVHVHTVTYVYFVSNM